MHLTGPRYSLLRVIGLMALVLVFLSSCSEQRRTVVRNYPPNKPFVYSNKINLTGTNLTKDEKKRLSTELENYWDDSLQVQKIQQFGFFYKIRKPPVFDSTNIYRSVNFMNAYLNAQGYFYPQLQDSVFTDTLRDQIRTHVIMNIDVGKNVTIDSVSFDLTDSSLAQLTRANIQESLLKKGKPYTKQVISDDLERLTKLYRQNGYFKLTRDDLKAVVDTVDTKLLTLTLDPFKQAELIAENARKRKENPAWDISIQNRPITDSSKLTRFYIGNIFYYPDTRLYDIPDTLLKQKNFTEQVFRSGTMRYRKNLFRYRPMREHTYLTRGELYNENDFYKSINTLGQINAWQQVDAITKTRGKDSLDIHFFLVPAIRQSFSVDLEGSRNSADVVTGNTLGISTSLTYSNKNVWKQAIQSLANIRTGIEVNLLQQNDNPLLQTFQVSAGHTYIFPRIIQPFGNWRSLRSAENKRTLFAINGAYVDRRTYYQIRSLATSWGYEWRIPKPTGDNIWLYKPLNVELYGITRLPGLELLIKNNPFLKASFNEGNIVSQTLSFIKTINSLKRPNTSHYIRVGIEEAGGLFGLLPGLKNNIYRYMKLEAEYRKLSRFRKTELAYRAFAGVGYNYSNSAQIGRTLPFFKQFIAGGPYSMRAWGLRQLGLGSSIFSDTVNSTYRDRFGDMQLEFNFEYRFPIVNFGSFKISSAAFADIGNIWNVKKNNDDPESRFAIKNLARDLAIGVGTGLRFDFSYFLIRFDLAYRVKDPAREYNNGWMSFRNFVWSETRSSGLKVNNLALQFGIGLPF